MDASPASAEDEDQTATSATTKSKLKPRPERERKSSRAHVVRPKTPSELRLASSRKPFTCTDCRQWFPANTAFFTSADKQTNWHWCWACAVKMDPAKVNAIAYTSRPPTHGETTLPSDGVIDLGDVGELGVGLRDLTPVGVPSIDDELGQPVVQTNSHHTVLMFELKIRGRQLFQLRFGRE